MLHFCLTGLEEVKDFLEQSFPNVEIAVAHGQVFFFI
jgi:transcription-repair coupling factor (superfamily II helicase)